MPPQPTFDLQAAHKYFSATCFNKTWEYIEKAERNAEENDAMLASTLASLWHWMQRDDCQPQNLPIGYWQVSRVYALIGDTANARHFGQRSLELGQAGGVEPAFIGFAYEALARAEFIAGNRNKAQEYLREARRWAEQVDDAEDKELLAKDLDGLENLKS